MGKVILCTGRLAGIPYTFVGSNTNVYSIEEMSYYLYTHIYEIYEDFLNDSLIEWVRTQLAMEELADKLVGLKENKNNLKDIVVTILCSNDYYTEKEMKELILVMDEIMDLPLIKRRKIRGDYFLKYSMYHDAHVEYESVLKDSEVKTLTEEEYGNILNNIGIVCAHITSYQEAAGYFKDAYRLNHKEESLYQYMLSVLLCGDEEIFEQERLSYQLSEEYKSKLYADLNKKSEEATRLPKYRMLQRISRLKGNEQEAEYKQQAERLLTEWKNEYRKQVES